MLPMAMEIKKTKCKKQSLYGAWDPRAERAAVSTGNKMRQPSLLKKNEKNVVASFGEAIKKDILSYLAFKVTMIEIYGWVAEGHPLKAPVFCKALTNASIEFVPPFLFSHPTVSSCFFFIITYVFLG